MSEVIVLPMPSATPTPRFVARTRRTSTHSASTESLASPVDASPVSIVEAACADNDPIRFRNAVVSGIQSGALKLVPVSDGLGGTYFVVGPRNRHVAVFKPSSQEVGMHGNPKGQRDVVKMGFPPGRGYLREIAAFDLDYRHFASVPLTVEVELLGEVGSLQAFVHSDGDGTFGPGRYLTEDVHRIGILDIRLLNCDRHEGNLLNIQNDRTSAAGTEFLHLIPIDHGYVLPEDGLQDLEFDWLYYPQAKTPFSSETLAYIRSLDADRDAEYLASMGFSEGVCENVKGATLVLQYAAACGYTLREIGEMCRRTHITQPSRLESALAAARVDMDLGGYIDWDAFRAQISETGEKK